VTTLQPTEPATEPPVLRYEDLPGPSLPALLQLAAIWTRPAGSMLRLRRFGKRAKLRLPLQPPIVVLSDPAEIRELVTADPTAVHPGEGTHILLPILGRHSVILLDEDLHLEQRRLLLPAFHGERMQRLAGLMGELTDSELAAWPTDEPIELLPRLQRLTLEIILRTVFGLEQGARLDALRVAVADVLEFAESPFSIIPAVHRYGRWLPKLRRFRRCKARADELIVEQVDERRAALRAGAEIGDDILSMLLSARHEDGTEMSDAEVRDELMTALVAGHETTASALSWAFVHLAGEPRVVERLTEELGAGAGDEYLTATVQEILRLRPVVPMLEPRLTKRPVRIGAIEYPAGVELLGSAFLVHHDPEIYPEPFAFRPERFLESPPGTYTWLPFGGGRRRCVGSAFALLEMKIVLAAALRRFALQAPGARPETTARRSVTFSPKRGATTIVRARARIGYDTADGGTEAIRSVPAEPSLAGDPVRGRQEVRQ
jgi:cytochrome P450